MVAALNSTDSLSLARSLAADLQQLHDLQRTDPQGAALLWESLANHVRASQPLLLQRPPRPLAAVKTELAHGAFVAMTREGVGLVLLVREASGRDAAVTMTVPQAEAHCRDVMAIVAGGAL
jgi:hypothetical protein